MKDLKKLFPGGISDIYDGRAWRRHTSAIVACEKPGQKIVWLAKPPSAALDNSEEIIAWGDQNRTEVAPNGYRPMMGHLELLDLHRAFPEFHEQYWLLALGSFTFDGNRRRCVGALYADAGMPRLGNCLFDGEWNGGMRFPLISK